MASSSKRRKSIFGEIDGGHVMNSMDLGLPLPLPYQKHPTTTNRRGYVTIVQANTHKKEASDKGDIALYSGAIEKRKYLEQELKAVRKYLGTMVKMWID